MNQAFLPILIGVLVVGAAILGFMYYQERQSGVQIKIDEHGVTIDGK